MIQLLIALVLMMLLAVVGLVWFTWNTKRGAEVAIPPRGRFLDLPGGRIHYTDEGTGPAIVMIHGLGGQMGNFNMALTPLLTGTHRVIVIDRPGMGYSTRAADAPANPRAQAETVVQLIDALRLERPLVVGHSLGGAIALCLAMEHPERTRGLALLAPLTQPPTGPIEAFSGLDIKGRAKLFAVSWLLAIPMSIRTAPQVLRIRRSSPNPTRTTTRSTCPARPPCGTSLTATRLRRTTSRTSTPMRPHSITRSATRCRSGSR